MICKQCGTEIADKAIVCYRCGTATTDPIRKPAPLPRRGGTLFPLIGLVALLAIGFYVGQAAQIASRHGVQVELWIAYVVLLALAIAVVLFRRIRRG